MTAPKSCTNLFINITGVIAALFLTVYLSTFHKTLAIHSTGVILICLAYALPIIILEWIFLRKKRSARYTLTLSQLKPKGNIKRVLTKLLGLYMCFIFVALVYWLLPEYHGSFYSNYMNILGSIILWLIILSIPYFYIIDSCMDSPSDAYLQLGKLCLGKKENFSVSDISQLFLGWLVKLYFLPLMFVYTGDNLNGIFNTSLPQIFNNFSNFYEFTYLTLFYIDLFIVVVGYATTMKILDNHIRSVEPTFLGWSVALICYQPFWSLFFALYISYDEGPDWGYWFSGHEAFYLVWGCLILGLILIYVWATVSFGIRFSNLTHRGIITNGPYRYTKHPAYIAKNISWWMISMPFMVSDNIENTIRHCLLLLILNFVYFLRARTEEKHLSRDPIYCIYANYIEKNGIFRWVDNLIPALKFGNGKLFSH